MKRLPHSEVQELVEIGWGSRANPQFWDYISEQLVHVELKSKEELVEFVKQLHRDVTGGKELKGDPNDYSYEYAEIFATGSGQGDGCLDGRFWLDKYPDAIGKIAEYLNLK